MEKQKIISLYQDIKTHALVAIREHNEGDYTQEEKDWNTQHWNGIIIGAETLMKKLLDESINYFNFDKN